MMATSGSLEEYDFKQKRRTLSDKKIPPAQSVSQPDPTEEIKFLKAFDLNYAYGPAVGLSRSERWKRAHGLGLNPDPRVKKLIQQHSDDPKYTECLWKGTLVAQ